MAMYLPHTNEKATCVDRWLFYFVSRSGAKLNIGAQPCRGWTWVDVDELAAGVGTPEGF